MNRLPEPATAFPFLTAERASTRPGSQCGRRCANQAKPQPQAQTGQARRR